MPSPAQVLHPDGFHGARLLARLRSGAQGVDGPGAALDGAPARVPRGHRGAFFEGWYVKLVSADRATRVALIPGVFVSEDGGLAEAFVQVLDGISGTTAYHRFDLADFHADTRRFDVRVGRNRFTGEGVAVDLPGLAAEVRFDGTTPWPVTLRSPGAMGWYAWVPTMECYHGVVSLDHALDGWIDIGAGRVDLSGGRGYMEKDWGVAFPEAYVWMQSNHFATPGASLVASTAIIPWRRSAFRGSIVGLRVPAGPAAGLHRFATYTGARTEELAIDDAHVRWSARARDGLRLELRATVGGRTAGLLHAPVRTQMHQRVAETLDGEVAVRLSDGAGTTLFEEVGGCAGIEVHGDVARLVSTPTDKRQARPAVVRTWEATGGRLAPRRGRRVPERRTGGPNGQG